MSLVQLARRDRAVPDAVSARLAELQLIRGLLDEAAVVVSAGWVQRGWFTTSGTDGGTRVVTAHNLGDLVGRPVTGACLVGAVVAAGGGPSSVRSQLVQRTLDLTWHALREDAHAPVRWCPAPAVRMAHVRDLTRWNDHPARTAADVVGLLRSAVGVAHQQGAACRGALVAG
jgi:hypothetical protein